MQADKVSAVQVQAGIGGRAHFALCRAWACLLVTCTAKLFYIFAGQILPLRAGTKRHLGQARETKLSQVMKSQLAMLSVCSFLLFFVTFREVLRLNLWELA